MPSMEAAKKAPVTDLAQPISPEVRIAAAQVVLSEGDIEVTEVLRDRREETLALVQRLLSSAGIEMTFSSPKIDEPQNINIEILEASQLQPQAEIKKELTPEHKEVLFSNLKAKFEANMNLHPGMNWAELEQKLKSSPAATLVTLHKMWERGGEPTVTDFDKKTGKYRFDDCSLESPEKGRDTTYPQAEQMAQDMGADLMEPEHYNNKFQKLGTQFDRNSWNWLKTTKEKLQAGVALYGGRYGNGVHVYEDGADYHRDYGGFRASLWV